MLNVQYQPSPRKGFEYDILINKPTKEVPDMSEGFLRPSRVKQRLPLQAPSNHIMDAFTWYHGGP